MIIYFVDWFAHNPIFAALSSILLNIIIAITGVLPSAFITGWTVAIFGFEIGLILLIIGEALGAIISFTLYRKGLRFLSSKIDKNKTENRFLRKLKDTGGIEAFLLVILLRLLPFVPSGIVTLTAAVSKMKLVPFSIASTLGKIPALYIESYSVVYVLNLKTEWQILLIIVIAVFFLFYMMLKFIQNRKK